MRSITTQRIMEMIRDGDTELYVRWSSGPESDRGGCSRDYSNGQSHGEYALCANPLVRQDKVIVVDELGYPMGAEWETDVEFCEACGLEKWVRMQCNEYSFLPGRPWIMRARRVGTDSDNAALVDSRDFEFLGYWAEN